MSQHDLSVADNSGASVRADINAALQALGSMSSGASAPATTYAHQFWADTTNNVLKQRNAANSGWLLRGSLTETFLVARSSDTVLAPADLGRFIRATSAFTQTLTAAATLGDGWYCWVRNDSTGALVLDPNGSELIDGATTLRLQPGQSALVTCDGSAFRTFGRPTLALSPAVATTSGATIDFTDIPSWAKRLTLNLSGLSTTGTSIPIVQIGDSGGVETSGYLGSAITAGGTPTNYTTGAAMSSSWAAASVMHGQVVLTLVDAATNTWAITSNVGFSNAGALGQGAFSKALSATLDRVRLTTVGGTDTFDAGSASILIE